MALRRSLPAAAVFLPVLALLVAACTSDGPGPPSSATSPGASAPSGGAGPSSGGPSTGPSRTPPSPAPSQNPNIGFDMLGGDAFAWTERVVGTAKCDVATIEVNGQPSGAKIQQKGPGFSATVTLVPGKNEVVAKCAASGTGTAASAPIVWNERLTPAPTAHIDVSVSGSTVTLDGSTSEPTQPDGSRVVRYTWTPKPAHPVTVPALTPGVAAGLRLASGAAFTHASGATLRLRAPAKDGEYYVTLEVADAQGRSDTSTTYFVVANGKARPVDMMTEHPSWIDHSVMYAPIPDLTEQGGPEGVEHELRRFKDLGVRALWLWPPAELRQFGEEYRILDYFKLDPQWQPASAFRSMVDAAHRLGMHVMLDIVPNHMSDHSPYFRDAQANGKASHYYDFFDRDKNGNPTQYDNIFGTKGLMNLNYDNPEVRSMIIDASLYWIRHYGIDGFRVDAAWGVQRRSPSFWHEWRAAVKRVDPDVILLGECTAIDPYCSTKTLDVQYDWTDQPGQWAWTSVFDFPQEAGSLLAPALTNNGKGFPPDAIPMRFLNNNDTDVKFVDQYGPELTRVASVLQFTVPGMPELFMGDEVGASYSPYSNLTPLDWTDRFHLKPLYEQLIRMKNTLPTLASHDIEVLPADTDGAIGYVRPAFGGGPPVLVALNFSDKTTVGLPLTPGVQSVVGKGKVIDLLTGHPMMLRTHGKQLEIPMAATSAFVFVPETGGNGARGGGR